MVTATRKIKAGYANVTAKIPSTKLNRMVDAESSLERDFIVLLEYSPEVISYLEQPVQIPLVNGRIYTPDFKVTYNIDENTTKTVIYEVKYRSELEKKWFYFKPKFKQAIKFCKNHDYSFKIITDKEIRTTRLKNIEFLSRFKSTISHSEEAYSKVLISVFSELVVASPEELLAMAFLSKIKQAEALPVLWRMVLNGLIYVDLDLPLSMNSPLTLDEELRYLIC